MLHFFFPLPLPFGIGAGLDAVDMTLEAREDGAADVALLAAPDLILSRALFWTEVSNALMIIRVSCVPLHRS